MEEIDKLITGSFVEYNIERIFDSEEEDEEEGEDIQWLGYKEVAAVNGGKSFVNYERPKLKTGELIDIVSRRPQKCRGPITLFKQWWQVTFLRTKVAKDKYKEPKDRYALCYRLRNDARCATDNLVQLLISDILNDRMTGNPTLFNTRNHFEQYLREISSGTNVTLHNLQEHLEAFTDKYSDPEVESGPEAQFSSAILGSSQFRQVKLGQTHPQLLHYLPQLFPFHFIKILGLKEDRLDGLVECLEQDPGCLAFKAILSKRYNVLGVETSKEALIKSGLMSQVPKHEQDAIEIYEYLKKETKECGHTWITFDRIMTALSSQVSMWDEAMEFLNKNKVTRTQIEAGHRIVFLYSLWKAENQIAKGLNSLLRKHEVQPWNLEVDFRGEEFESIMADNDQSRAARLISSEPVCAISGKGGCGKTYVVSKVLTVARANRSKLKPPSTKQDCEFDDDMTQKDETIEDPDRCPDEVNILLTAPTGKAANLLGKRADMTACTLHQVIWSYRMLKPDQEWKHKDVNILVVDECSLVSVSTMAFLLELMLKNSKLRRVVLLGDIRQLPSIEPGNFLKDTFQSLEVLGYSVELRTNHRSESQAIVDNATAISNKQYPKFDGDKFVFRRLPENSPETSGNDYMLQDINDDITKLLSHEALKCHVNSQFISFTRRVCEAVNDLCCKHYSKHRIKEFKKFIFRVGDKVCCTKNGYVNIYEEKHGLMSCTKDTEDGTKQEAGGVDRTILSGTVNDTMMGGDGDKTLNPEETEQNKPKTKQIRLCNGEIFFITDEIERQTDQGQMRTFLGLSEDGDIEKTFWVEKRQLRKACKLRHAWARTIHTFQGSETDHVVYIVGSRSWRQNWQHVYTAVTRGRKTVFIVGQESILRSAIRRPEIRRQTGLKKQLLQYFQKDKKLSPTHAVDSSILIPIERPKFNKLTNLAKGIEKCQKDTNKGRTDLPSTSRGCLNEEGYLNSTQDILSSLASEHDQPEDSVEDTCQPEEESQSILQPSTNTRPSTSTDIRQFYKPVHTANGTATGVLKSDKGISSINQFSDSEEVIDEYISDEEGKQVESQSLLITPSPKKRFTKLKLKSKGKSRSNYVNMCSSSRNRTENLSLTGTNSCASIKCDIDDKVSPIVENATVNNRQDLGKSQVVSLLTNVMLTSASSMTTLSNGLDRSSYCSPFLSCHTSITKHTDQTTSSPILASEVTRNDCMNKLSRPSLSDLDGEEIKAPGSNESMWSDADDSIYFNINDSHITMNVSSTMSTCTQKESGIRTSRKSMSDYSIGRSSLGLRHSNSPTNGIIKSHEHNTPNGSTLNITNQSTCSQWSEIDDEQYITGLDLTDIENMATQKHPTDSQNMHTQRFSGDFDENHGEFENLIDIVNMPTQKYPNTAQVTPDKSFNNYRRSEFVTPPDEQDYFVPCTPLELDDQPTGIKRQLSWNQTEVSPMKRRLASLKFE